MEIGAEIRRAAGAKKIIVGARATLRALEAKKIAKIIVAENCPTEILDSIKLRAEKNKVDVLEFKGSSADLGGLCGKPFAAVAIGLTAK